MSNEIIDYIEGMIIGRGFDTLSGDLKVSSAVDGAIGIAEEMDGSSGTLSYLNIDSSHELENALDFSASASFGLGGFGGSAKAEYKNSCKFNTKSTFCMIRYRIRNPVRMFTETPVLTKDAEDLLRAGNSKRFRQRFGNRFVSGLITGGFFYGTVAIQSSKVERQQEFRAQIEAKFGPGSAGAEGGWSGLDTSADDKITINVWQAGGRMTTTTSLVEVLASAEAAALATQTGHGVPIYATLEPYSELALPRDDLTFVEYQHVQATLEKLGKDYRALQVIENDIDFVLQNQAYFEDFDVRLLNKAGQKIADNLNKIMESAGNCVRYPENCQALHVDYPEVDLPKRKRIQKPSPGGPVIAHFLPPNPTFRVRTEVVRPGEEVDEASATAISRSVKSAIGKRRRRSAKPRG